MGSVRITETTYVGDSSSSVEYEFSDSVDFLAWESDKTERLNNAIKSYVGGLSSLGGESPFENEDAGNVTEIKVAEKTTKH
jgi:hypothetical protein